MTGGQPGGSYLRALRLDRGADQDGYPFDLPVVKHLLECGGLALSPGVTFLVGENGSGKSTLVEALAVALGMNPEGGSQNYRFTTRATESPLGDHVILTWNPEKPRTRFFLRAESYYNVATETEALGPEQLAVFGGISPHERSHGESFVDLMRHRFYPHGLYLLDEPEAALSPQGCMAVLSLLSQLVSQNCQLIISTHSPILLALPGATIYEISDQGTIDPVPYDTAMPVRLTRDFLTNPNRYLRHLIERD